MSINYSVLVDVEYNDDLRRLWLDDGIQPDSWRPDGALEAAVGQGGLWVARAREEVFVDLAGHHIRTRTAFGVVLIDEELLEGTREMLSFVGRLVRHTRASVVLLYETFSVHLVRVGDDLVLSSSDDFWREEDLAMWGPDIRYRRAELRHGDVDEE